MSSAGSFGTHVPWVERLSHKKGDVRFAVAVIAVFDSVLSRQGLQWTSDQIELATHGSVDPLIRRAHVEVLEATRQDALSLLHAVEGDYASVSADFTARETWESFEAKRIRAYRKRVDLPGMESPFTVNSIGIAPSPPWLTDNGPSRDDLRYARYWHAATKLALYQGQVRYEELDQPLKASLANECIEVVSAYRHDFGLELPVGRETSARPI